MKYTDQEFINIFTMEKLNKLYDYLTKLQTKYHNQYMLLHNQDKYDTDKDNYNTVIGRIALTIDFIQDMITTNYVSYTIGNDRIKKLIQNCCIAANNIYTKLST